MRCGLILAIAVAAMSATTAHAQEWCGYAAQAHSIVECGYSSFEGCENAIGKGAMCFVNPYLVLNSKRSVPVIALKRSTGNG